MVKEINITTEKRQKKFLWTLVDIANENTFQRKINQLPLELLEVFIIFNGRPYFHETSFCPKSYLKSFMTEPVSLSIHKSLSLNQKLTSALKHT